jgi:hypothetical protein
MCLCGNPFIVGSLKISSIWFNWVIGSVVQTILVVRNSILIGFSPFQTIISPARVVSPLSLEIRVLGSSISPIVNFSLSISVCCSGFSLGC